MKSNAYKPWYRRNDPQDWRKDLSAYNRPFKERYERPPEYTPSVEAYKHYPAMKDLTADQEEKRKDAGKQDQQSNSRQNQQSKISRGGQGAVRSVVQTVVGNTVALVVGAAVVVTGYQTMTSPSRWTENWSWAADNQSVVFALTDKDGDLITELPAIVDVDTFVEATCTTDGLKNYIATVEYDERTYTDTHSEILPALGHDFDDGTPTIIDGEPGIVYECSQCHKTYSIKGSLDEN